MQTDQHASADYTISLKSAQNREKAWRILRNQNAHFSWPPNAIDIALNAAQSTRGITFDRLCGSAAQLGDFDEHALQSAPTDATQALILNWCMKRAFSWRAGCSRRIRLEVEDVAHQLKGMVIEKAPQYIPHRYCGKRIISHGFEAWLTWSTKGLFKSIERSLRGIATVSLDAPVDGQTETLHSQIADPRVPSDTESIHSIGNALRSSLSNLGAWTLFFALAYSGKSLREIATERSVSRSNLSRIARPIVERLQAELGGWYSDRRNPKLADITHIARKSAGLWSMEEFLALCPTPVITPASLTDPRNHALGRFPSIQPDLGPIARC